MTLAIAGETNRLARNFVILAPPTVGESPFSHLVNEPSRHGSLLAEAQTLRGSIYLQDGAIQKEELTCDGRHIQPADDLSWHLLTVNPAGNVTACIRYLAHRPGAAYSELTIPNSVSQQSSTFKAQFRRAVQAELDQAARLGFAYVELGGWVVGEELRCSTEAIRMLLMMFALSRSLGGALALSTATTRHSSAAILRRTGGQSISDGETDLSPYHDTHHNCEMEVLRFDSRFPNPRYAGWIREFTDSLRHIQIISTSSANATSGLLQLHSAVAEECTLLSAAS